MKYSFLQEPESDQEKAVSASPLKKAIRAIEPAQKPEPAAQGEIKKEPGFFQSPYLQLVIFLFLADWGDRCQISAVVLTTTYNVYGVALGGAMVTIVINTLIGNGSVCLLSCHVWRFRC